MKKLNNRNILIVISIIALLFGIGITSFVVIKLDKDNKEIRENIKENENNTDNDTELNSTINDDESKDSDVKEESVEENNNNHSSTSPNTSVDKQQTNNNSSKPNNSSTDNSNSSSNNSSMENKPETENNQDVKPEVPGEEDKNNIKRNSMENTYGIKILYGNEIGDYKPKGITPIKLTDSSDIENYLNRLNGELAKYPKGFFNDFNKKGMPLTIYLIKSANGAFSGFTDYQFMNNIKLSLTTSYDFEYTLHHELMHYIDCYLDIVMYPNNPYSEYEAMNPSDFVYGSASSNQIYNMGNNQKGAYFISSYGATHVKEDRAEVFKFMTARAYKPIGCFDDGEVIRKKAEIISKQIKTYFPSVTGSAHWDRFIS